ncbi:hypothetical protein [Amycolatopsis rubida]|uniref:hypothetical protein n=1 Tax=Amycolatopsis rubida TaxID=112413 RepID=UPI001160C2F7|nr:hypothetical protein [Amycolatopsis rubida]
MRSDQYERTGLPLLTVDALRAASLTLPDVESVSVPLSAAGGGKRHVPVPEKVPYYARGCRHAPSGEGVPAVLIEALPTVCKHCLPRLEVPQHVAALWNVAARIVSAHAELERMRSSTRARTWPGYAAALAAAPRNDDSAVAELLEAGSACTGDRARLAEAWSEISAAWDGFLRDYRRAAPAADLTAAVSAACEAAVADPAMQRQASMLSRIVADADGWGRRYPLAGLAIEAWKAARSRGDGARGSLDFALVAVGEHLGGKHVRDVSLLPRPARTPYLGDCSPGAWADREFDRLWRDTVAGWVGILETEYRAPEPERSDDHQLILVASWPLTRRGDRELAYLSQYDQIGPAVPAGRRRLIGDYGMQGWEPAWSVVLAVPAFAAAHAADLASVRHGQQSIPGPVLSPGSDGAAEHALRMLRTRYPYLPGDAEADGARARPTRTVIRARAERRPVHGNVIRLRPSTGHVADGSREQAWSWCEGRTAWIPDDTTGSAPAIAVLNDILDQIHRPSVLVEVETGPRPATTRHRLAGDLVGLDAARNEIRFAPLGGHAALRIPLRRVIAVTGHPDQHDEDSELDPGWLVADQT